MKSNTILNDDPFCNPDTQRLFEAIDQLRSCGANHHIDLPELVIVGDQSAGKSSLLQSLTDIPFPVADRLCTRFPTRIVSRRTPNQGSTTKISIEPRIFDWSSAFLSNEKEEDRAKRLEAYSNFAYSRSDISPEDFKDAIERANELMDIKRPASAEKDARTVGGRNFSNDVLKVEISGPDRSYFSILDVPGVFQSLTKGLTDLEKNGVKNMVASYMMPKHSVIICVASGTNDLANQAAFDMASKHDPQLQRTVGVITKCDITQHKDQIVSLAQNEEKHLNHGWFVVRNRTPSEVFASISSSERHKREKDFFDHEPWVKLPERRRGTQALKHYLADLLCDRIQETFPSFLATIRDRKAETRDRLVVAGPSRDTTKERRTFLTELAQQLHILSSKALLGRYHGLSKESLKLRRFVREANDAFSSTMLEHGHSVPFHVSSTHPREPRETKETAMSGSNAFSASYHDGGFGNSEVAPFGGIEPQQGNTYVGLRVPGTKGHEFHEPVIEMFGGRLDHYQTICMTKPYEKFLFEELRLSDYLQAQSSFSNPSNGTPFFGSSTQPQSVNPSSSHSSFGSATSTGSPFGASSRSRKVGRSSRATTSTPESHPPAASAHPKTTNGLAPTDSYSTEIYTWIREEIHSCRGTELQGTLNPDVLPALFHRQIAKWKGIATSHFQSVAQTTAKTMEQAVEAACRTRFTAQKIKAMIWQTNRASEDCGVSQIHQRFQEIMTRHLQTQNPIFEMNIRDARLARFKAALERYQHRRSYSLTSSKAHLNASEFFEATPDPNAQKADCQHQSMVDIRDVSSLFDELHMSNAQNLEDEIHDTLRSYYELALHDFIEFVTQQVVESYLTDPRGPVLFFNPTYISYLSSHEIDELGAEEPDIVQTRKEQQDILTRLNRAEEIALQYS